MRNKVTIIVFLVLIILLTIAIFVGIKLGGFEILSVSQLKEKNSKLEEKIKEATTLTSVDYPQTVQTLEQTYEKYNIQKQKYEEISGFTKGDKIKIYETKQYDIGYLWERVGKYANKYNLTINMDVKKGGTENFYDLYFSVVGKYVNISQFIADIENNSNLYFRIYNFKMNEDSSEDTDTVSASFVVEDVNIDPSTITILDATDTTFDVNTNTTTQQ